MKLLVTGANGFVGRYVLAEAIRKGHFVRALVRPNADVSAAAWSSSDRVEIVRADLQSREGLADAVRGVDCVVHLAAAKTGDAHAQHQNTVVGTQNLLDAMTQAGVARLVAISSFSVYDFIRASSLTALDEQSPLEKDGLGRDAYAQTKLVQERLIREYADRNDGKLTVIRPGMIWGRDNLLNAWVGMRAGRRVWIRTGASARVPLTYVENCAEAIVLAVESQAAIGQTFNVVDDDLPTQREYLAAVLGRLPSRPIVIPLSYTLLRLTAAAISLVHTYLLRGRGKVPGLLIPCRLQARARPLMYSNQKLTKVLGWRQQYSLPEALDRTIAPQMMRANVALPNLSGTAQM